jgi:hypothetical protein
MGCLTDLEMRRGSLVNFARDGGQDRHYGSFRLEALHTGKGQGMLASVQSRFTLEMGLRDRMEELGRWFW